MAPCYAAEGMPRSALTTSRARLVAWAGLGVVLAISACDRTPTPGSDREAMLERVDDVLPRPATPEEALPGDRAAILRELAPLPTEALLVVYEVQGPGGVTGSLEVLARPGGYRRENWTIQVPLGAEGSRQLDGSTIQTPDGVWIDGSDPPVLTPSPLGALANAYLALPTEERRAVVQQLRGRRELLEQARAADAVTGAEPERILDVPCHVTRVATIELCLWEATGLPLRYVSDGLRLRAINIDLRASIGEHAFDLPGSVPRVAVPGFDPAAALQRLAKGDLADVAPYLHPGLRLPT